MIFILLFLLLLFTNSISDAEVVQLNDFSCGLVLGDVWGSGLIANKTGPNCVKNAANVYFKKIPGTVISREFAYGGILGTVVNNNSNATVEGLVQFFDNSGGEYLITRSSQVIATCSYASACTNKFTSLNSTTSVSMVSGLSRVWNVGGGTRPGSIDRNLTFALNNTAPMGTMGETFRNRLLITGVGSNRSRVYLSGELNGEDWALGSQSTSPAIITVGGVNDILPVTCLMGSHNDTFIIGKLNSLWGFSGFGLEDFTLYKIADGIGCTAEKSVVHMSDGSMIWLSNNGFYQLTSGMTLTHIGKNLGDLEAKLTTRHKLYANGNRIFNTVAVEREGNYWVSYTTMTASAATIATANDNILVYESNGGWTLFNGLNAGSFAYYGVGLNPGDLIYGNSNGTGQIYQFGCYGSDSCAPSLGAFEASFETQELDFGLPDVIKSFETLYVDFHPTPILRRSPYDTFSMPISYRIDSLENSAAEVVVATITVSGTDRMYSARINLGRSGIATAPKGRWIRFKFKINAEKNPFYIQGIRVYASKMGQF